MSFLRADQRQALLAVAREFGWDRMPIQSVGLVMWCAFHYYVIRLGGKSDD